MVKVNNFIIMLYVRSCDNFYIWISIFYLVILLQCYTWFICDHLISWVFEKKQNLHAYWHKLSNCNVIICIWLFFDFVSLLYLRLFILQCLGWKMKGNLFIGTFKFYNFLFYFWVSKSLYSATEKICCVAYAL